MEVLKKSEPIFQTKQTKNKLTQIHRQNFFQFQDSHSQHRLLNDPQDHSKQNTVDLQNSSKVKHKILDKFSQQIENLNYNQFIKQEFYQIFRNSLKIISQKSKQSIIMQNQLIELIETEKNLKQNKIYNLLLGDVNSYLEEYFEIKMQDSIKIEKNPVEQINVKKMNFDIAKRCAHERVSMIYHEVIKGKFPDLFLRKFRMIQQKKKLEYQISQLRKCLVKDNYIISNQLSLPYQSADERKQKKQNSLYQILSARKKYRWQDKTESHQIQLFIDKINKQKNQTHHRYQKSLQIAEKRNKLYFFKLAENKTLQIKNNVQQNLKKHLQIKQNYQKDLQKNQKKQKQIEKFLQKYQSTKPLYEKMAEQFQQWQKKQNQFDQKILDTIHFERRAMSLFEFENHRKLVSEKINSKKQQTKKFLNQMKSQQKIVQQKLKKLFHSKHHSRIKQDDSHVPVDEKQIKKEKMQKSLQYSLEIVAKNHKPRIDLQKQKQIKKIIEEQAKAKEEHSKKITIKRKIKTIKPSQEEKEDKINKKIENSKMQNPTRAREPNQRLRSMQQQTELQLEEIEIELDPRKIGIQYLKQLKLLNQGKPRTKNNKNQQKSLEGKKIFDYSKEKKDYFKIKMTLSEWKKVLQSKTKRLSEILNTDLNITNSKNNLLSNQFSLNKSPQKFEYSKLSIQQKSFLLDPFMHRIAIDENLYEKQKKKIPQKNVSRVLSLDKKLEKCYIEGIRSRLQILKQ